MADFIITVRYYVYYPLLSLKERFSQRSKILLCVYIKGHRIGDINNDKIYLSHTCCKMNGEIYIYVCIYIKYFYTLTKNIWERKNGNSLSKDKYFPTY